MMMSPRAVIPLGALWLLTCGPPEGGSPPKSDQRDEEFSRKRFCAEIGRTRLAEDNREKHPEAALFSYTKVYADWCYSKTLNTCIYSSTLAIADKKKGEETPIFLQSREVVDLLTNRTLVALSLLEASDQTKVAGYDKKQRELFKECQ
jgi:hypothetical protein